MVKNKIGGAVLTSDLFDKYRSVFIKGNSQTELINFLESLKEELEEKSVSTAKAFVQNNDQVTRGLALSIQGQCELVKDMLFIVENQHIIETRHKK